ncbi:hypothetical protein M422DRAFT_270687, partial [Sphaerobolus stellatus SS14]
RNKTQTVAKKDLPKTRQGDVLDQSLIISGTRTRKPTARAKSSKVILPPVSTNQELPTIDEDDENEDRPSVADMLELPIDDILQLEPPADEYIPPGSWNVSESPTATDFSLSTDSVAAIPAERVPVIVKKGAKHAGVKAPKKRDDEDPNKALKEAIILHIPIKSSSGNTCITKIKIPIAKSFEDVREIIHDEIGCGDVPEHHFPDLMLHFSKDTKNTVWPLKSERHWEDAKENWELEVMKKKQTSCVEVRLDSKWLADFEASKKLKNARSKGSNTAGKGAASGNGRAAKVASRAKVTDFYAASDAEDDATVGYDDSEFDASVAAKQAELISVLEDCNTCNANKNPQDHVPCHVNKNGLHKKINHDMVKVWVLSLVKGEAGVTLNLPPKRDPFMEFHHFIPGATIANTLSHRHDRREIPTAVSELEEVTSNLPHRSQSVPPGYGNYGYAPPPVCFMPPPMLPKIFYKAMGYIGDYSSSPEQS